MSVKFVLIINPKNSPPKGGSEKREKKGKNAVDSGHYVLPATAKGSARNLLGQNFLFFFKLSQFLNVSVFTIL